MSGIYTILNKTNGRCYVGSAHNCRSRFSGHRYLLNRNAHHCPPLQNAWNKYGPSAFDFVVLEECEQTDLLIREQVYLDSFSGLYNVSYTATSRLGVKQGPKSTYKTYPELKSPTGQVYGPVTNLKEFCSHHGLRYKSMNQVVHRAKGSHQGWTLAEATPRKRPDRWNGKRIPDVVSPTGIVFSGCRHQINFCKEHGISLLNFRKLITGKLSEYRGWKLVSNV
jgi:group I intron endonuclease